MINLVYHLRLLGATLLTQRAPHLWTVDHALTVGGFLPMGTRTTVLRLPDGRLVVVAPGDLDATDVAAIRALGPVAAVVAPNPLHYLFLGKAAAAFPEAEVWGAPGVEAKAKDVRVTHTFDGRAGPWGDALALHAVEGAPKLAETVIFDARSRTLVLTDLCFNIRNVGGWFARLNLQMLGAYGKFGPSFLMRNVYVSDTAGVRRSVHRILDWDFDRVVVTHGDVVETGGRDGFRAAWSYLE